MDMQMPSILDTFSPEILDLILKEVRGCEPDNLKRIRLVCKIFNRLVEPMVFDTLELCYPGAYPGRYAMGMGDIISSVTSGTSPFIRCATKLRVWSVDPSTTPLWMNSLDVVPNTTESGSNEGNLMATLSIQAQVLIPAIEALTKLTWVEYDWDPKETEAYVEIVRALSNLPELRGIDIETAWDPSVNANLNFALFSNLIEIQCQLFLDLSMVPHVGAMIANCPNLASLLLNVSGRNDMDNHLFDFTDFIKPSLASPAFQPSLKSLRMFSAWSMILSPSCIPFLRCLTRLEFYPLHKEDPHFWPALTASTIRLRYLRIPRLSLPVAQYLTSYTGLEEFVFDYSMMTNNRPRGLSTEEEVRLLYHSILPKHRKTLRTLGLACNPEPPNTEDDTVNEEWLLSHEHLEQIVACSSLEHLEIMYYHYDPCDSTPGLKPRFPLDTALSTIASKLPRLHELKLLLDCRPHFHGSPPTSRMPETGWWAIHPKAPWSDTCIASICDIQFQVTPSSSEGSSTPQFRVKADWNVLRPRAYRPDDLPGDQLYHLEVFRGDYHKKKSRACTTCGERWTSHAMSYDLDWESLL